MPATDRQFVELVEILAGKRAGANEKAAVRVEDLQELLQLGALSADLVTSAPTMEQHNALVRDVKEVHRRLSVIATVLQRRLLR